MADLYIRPDEAPAPLPFSALDSDGRLWTDLANNEEGRNATAWNKLAPPRPQYDAATQSLTWNFQTGKWVIVDLPPVEPVLEDEEVTMRQARLALLSTGYLDVVNQAIADAEGEEGEFARIEWEYAQVLKRSHPLVTQFGVILGLDETAKDVLFALAATFE